MAPSLAAETGCVGPALWVPPARHSAVTNLYRASRDLFLAQRFARRVSPLTTVVYKHPSDEEMYERVRGLPF